MKILSFELTMPNVGSWNGKWSGAAKKYFVIKSMDNKSADKILDGNDHNAFYYSFGDGWGANVRVEHIDSKEAAKRRKISSGFCGYEWMIDSIRIHYCIKI
jgi:hypothetical protein